MSISLERESKQKNKTDNEKTKMIILIMNSKIERPQQNGFMLYFRLVQK